MASYPDFDPNDFNKSARTPAQPRVPTSTSRAPHSKSVPVSAALNEGAVGPEDRFDCNAQTATYRGKALRLPKEAHPMGTLTVRDIVKKSSNKGSAQLGMIIGEKRSTTTRAHSDTGRKPT